MCRGTKTTTADTGGCRGACSATGAERTTEQQLLEQHRQCHGGTDATSGPPAPEPDGTEPLAIPPTRREP